MSRNFSSINCIAGTDRGNGRQHGAFERVGTSAICEAQGERIAAANSTLQMTIELCLRCLVTSLNQESHSHLVLFLQMLEQTLEAYVSHTVPKDHPMYPVVSQSLQMLLHNPNWDYHKKCAYMERLISDLV